MISRCLIFSPDNNFIGTGDYDFTARIWELKTRQVVWALTGFRDTVGAVAFSSNGLFAAGSWDGTIKVCNVNGKTELATLTGHKAAVVQLAFASDGQSLASGSNNGAVKLWNLPVGREVLSFKTEFYQYFVRFSPDNDILATGGDDGVVHLWRDSVMGEDRSGRGEEGLIVFDKQLELCQCGALAETGAPIHERCHPHSRKHPARRPQSRQGIAAARVRGVAQAGSSQNGQPSCRAHLATHAFGA